MIQIIAHCIPVVYEITEIFKSSVADFNVD